jgi:hypothetical protein
LPTTPKVIGPKELVISIDKVNANVSLGDAGRSTKDTNKEGYDMSPSISLSKS